MIYQHDRRDTSWESGQINTDQPAFSDPDLIWKTGNLEMYRYLSSRGLNYELAVHNGWTPILRKGLRIYIPATSRLPGHVYWQARGIEGQELRYDSPFGPRRDALVILRGKVQLAQPTVCVVEGPMDALAMVELTGVTGVALMGATPSQEAKDHLVDVVQGFEQVMMIPDQAEIEAMIAVQNYLAVRGIASQLKIPFDKKDIAEYDLKERRALIEN